MNDDIRLNVAFWDHPKTIKLISALGREGVEALQRLWCFAAQFKPKGRFSGMSREDIELAAKWNGKPGTLVKTLLKLKLLDKRNRVIIIHDWKEHNSYCVFAPERAVRARNAAKIRWKKDKESNATSISNSITESSAPSPLHNTTLPSPSPSHRPDWLLESKWCEFLGQLTKKLSPAEEVKQLENLKALIDKGFDQFDLIQLSIDKAWRGIYSNEREPSTQKKQVIKTFHPSGHTCEDCVFFYRCEKEIKMDDKICQFDNGSSRSRFELKPRTKEN